MNTRQTIATIGSVLFGLGSFLPLMHGPIGYTSYFPNRPVEGSVVIFVAVLALTFALMRVCLAAAVFGWLGLAITGNNFFNGRPRQGWV
jgi:hypothetical protein